MSWISRRLQSRRWRRIRQLRRAAGHRGREERYARLLAIQHYIGGKRQPFDDCMRRLRELGDGDDHALMRSRTLVEVLEANENLLSGDAAAAEQAYRKAIARVGRELDETGSMRVRLNERRKQESLSIALGILYSNLAEALAWADPESSAVTETFEKAIEHLPNLPLIREMAANHFMARRRWAEAEAAFVDAHLCEPTARSEERLQENLAGLRYKKASALADDGEFQEAIDLLGKAIKALPADAFDAWRGKLSYGLGEIRRRGGNLADAASSMKKGSESYLRSGDFASASYTAEVAAEVCLASGDAEEARALLDRSLEHAGKPHRDGLDDPDQRAEARAAAKAAVTLLALGRMEDARRMLDRSVDAWRANEWFSPTKNAVAEAAGFIAIDAAAAIRLRLELERRLRAAKDPAETRDLIDAVRNCNGAVLPLLGSPAMPEPAGGQDNAWRPVAVPIVLEIEARLMHLGGGPDRIVETLVPAMRKRIQERYGVKIPGIRLREIELGQDGAYAVMINEIPVHGGVAAADRRLHVGDAARLDAADVKHVPHAQKRICGEQAVLVERGDWSAAERAGIALLDRIDTPIRELEAVLEANLVEFVGHQEVQNLLETSDKVGPDSDDIVAKEACGHMDPLTNVLRALVAERVPIKKFAAIYDIYSDASANGDPPWRVVEVIRAHPSVRPTLWGNDDRRQLVGLGPTLLAAIERGVEGPDGTVLSLEPETIREMLAAMRRAIEPLDRPVVVSPRRRWRSVIRRLFEIEFPLVPVLAVAELEPGLPDRIEATAELDETGQEKRAG